MFIKRKITLLVFLLLSMILSASNIGYKLEYMHGFIINHDKNSVGPLIKKQTNGGEFAVEFNPNGNFKWQYRYNLPKVGIGLNVLDLGNVEKLGQAITLYPYMEFPLWKTTYFNLNLKAGIGFSYLTKCYDGNPKEVVLPDGDITFVEANRENDNFAIGSHVNMYANLTLYGEVGFTKDKTSLGSCFKLFIGAGVCHYSNATIKQPNAGLNIFQGAIGLRYVPRYELTPEEEAKENRFKKRNNQIQISAGLRQLFRRDERYFLIGALRYSRLWQTSKIQRVVFTGDFFYDGAFNGRFHSSDQRYPSITEDKFSNKIRAGIAVGNDFTFNRFYFGIHWGVYVYNPVKEDGWNYFRVTAGYRITDWLQINAALKTHLQKAEFLEMGLGFNF